MVCEHCGTQNPDNTRICTNCGMPVGERGGKDDVKTETVEIKTSKNVMKRKSLLLVIGIPLALYIIGRMAGGKIGESMNKNTQPPASVVESTDTVTEDESKVEERPDNAEYTKIFRDRSIIKASPFTIEESACFAKVDVDEDGVESIDCMDFSYDGDTDVISVMTETIYYNIKDMSQEEVQAVDAAFQEEFAKNANVENYKASGEIGGQYYRVEYELRNINDENVVKTFEDLGILESREVKSDFFSMSLTEKDLLAQGYVKK